MSMYSVDEAFETLNDLKITTNKESVRRWLRNGDIIGIPPTSRKEGWKITEDELNEFIKKRLPDSYTTNVVNNNATNDVKEQARAEMWIELVNKNIWEDNVEIKKTRLHECIQHRGYSKQLEDVVWDACQKNKRGYSKPRISYLLDAFGFDGTRILLDKDFESIEEQIIFAIIEYVKKKNVTATQ